VRTHLLDDGAEGGRVVDGHVGKDLAVDVDLGLFRPAMNLL